MLKMNETNCMDCLEGLKLLKDNSIDLTVTSPPYDNMREYKGYSFDFENIAKELFRVTKKGGVVVWIVNDQTYKGSETGTSFKQALYFKEIGFNLHDTMIWRKTNLFNFGSNNCYIQSFEFMFILSKGKPKTMNFLYDRANKTFEEGKKKTYTGATRKGDFRQKDENREVELTEMGKRHNVWDIPCSTKVGSHTATFPEQLANDHILSWSNKGDIVMDIFSGSGTTHKMALLNNRRYIGFELSQEYIDIENERLEQCGLK